MKAGDNFEQYKDEYLLMSERDGTKCFIDNTTADKAVIVGQGIVLFILEVSVVHGYGFIELQ